MAPATPARSAVSVNHAGFSQPATSSIAAPTQMSTLAVSVTTMMRR